MGPVVAAVVGEVEAAAGAAGVEAQVWMKSCHMPQRTVLGWLGSRATSEAPVWGLTKRTRRQDLPPSRER